VKRRRDRPVPNRADIDEGAETSGSARDRPHRAGRLRDHALVRAFGLLRGHRLLLAVVFALTIGVVVVSLVTPWLFGQAVGAVQEHDESRIVWLGVAVAGAGALVAVLSSLQQLLSGRLAIDLERALRNEVYGHLLDLDGTFHHQRQAGQLVSLIMITSRPIRQFLAVSLPKITSDLLTFLFAGVAMAVIDPRLAGLSLWPIPIVAYLVARMGRVLTPAIKARQEAMADVSASAEETLRQMLTVDVLDAAEPRAAHLEAATNRWFSISSVVVRAGALYDSAIESLPNFAWAGLFVAGGYSVVDGTLSLSTLVTFLAYVGLMLSPVSNLGYRLWTTQSAVASAQRVFDILDRRPLIADRSDAAALERAAYAVGMRGVTKAFDGQLNAVDAVELDVAARSNVAIVGPTGSGKSLLLSMIERLHDPDAGDVLVDGRPISELELTSLRATVASVRSAPHLFPMSVIDNITYGATDASPDDVRRIGRALAIDADIAALPDGYATVVGETGVAIPLALAQCVSIARALVRRPGILLLDDVTAPLPPAVERTVVEGLRNLTRDMTVIAVASRPALLALADDIVLLDRGNVRGRGTFEQLTHESAAFRQFVLAWRLDLGTEPNGGGR
jgi:ATP-binding cassette, subfamily B, bacterial